MRNVLRERAVHPSSASLKILTATVSRLWGLKISSSTQALALAGIASAAANANGIILSITRALTIFDRHISLLSSSGVRVDANFSDSWQLSGANP